MNLALKKRTLGQFFTKNPFWLKKHILEFIKSTKANIAFDPFAGDGDLLNLAKQIGFKKMTGLDIDRSLNWKINDSLLNIPKVKNSVLITNPPYLTNYSAKRKGIYDSVKKYFDICKYDDLYQLAVEKCLSNDFGVMIIPETFINSGFPKNRLISVTIIENQLFNDTENPVCVICFDNKNKLNDKIKVYKNDKLLGNLSYFEKMRKIPHKNIYMKFNSPKGQIALRAVDTTNPQKPISFMKPEEIDYDLSDIKHSSRLITVIELEAKNDAIDKMIEYSNDSLVNFRKKTHDVLLSPFKGNKKNGERRRRLDYLTARAILEDAYEFVNPDAKLKLF
ncbi:hypothetical protein A2661_00860 [Candidatus Giovannonibacteria bacterium RIFCSPHIGHO2_01_FULL_45_24]|uniref:Uncharacterized protein n=1 Tax=Candidatus Giovannonibacteria bacterium RIFCSPLOWO2_01_FULL_46_32 TaxID=1798353 RepID=A0A1F5XF97_9BACT|nr:MAG: hypothetical protein A2661_00860 [Candidatus Giovannonibacteria bacterium RIFCSPHIGHO2_01_FULL_45_24]OGF86613.1 MAG: hypothetical protein A3B19_00175 [Candidatus Giovannonibacteria bacterium RIFCSPLOWO2_01_FULL_46_32]